MVTPRMRAMPTSAQMMPSARIGNELHHGENVRRQDEVEAVDAAAQPPLDEDGGERSHHHRGKIADRVGADDQFDPVERAGREGR